MNKSNILKIILLILFIAVWLPPEMVRPESRIPDGSAPSEDDCCFREAAGDQPFSFEQTLDEGYFSFDLVTSAAGAALGEAYAASPYGYESFRINPANLAGTEGVEVYYNFRAAALRLSDDAYCYSMGLSMNASLLKLGFDFSRYLFKVDEGSTLYNPQPGPWESYNHTITASAAIDIYGGLTGGASFKYFNMGTDYSGSVPDQNGKGAWFGDIGILYQSDGIIARELTTDSFSLGLALQNLGTEFESYAGYKYNMPRYLRAGASYRITTNRSNKQEFLRFTFTCEYRRFLNPDRFQEGETDYGNLGMEFRFLEALSLRFGGITKPYNSIYGDKNDLMLRWGLGYKFSLKRWYPNAPVNLSLDYAYIPLDLRDLSDNENDNLSVYTFYLNYEKSLF